jgi:hypothetical protein
MRCFPLLWRSFVEPVCSNMFLIPGNGALVNIQSSCYLILGISGLETTDSDMLSGRV